MHFYICDYIIVSLSRSEKNRFFTIIKRKEANANPKHLPPDKNEYICLPNPLIVYQIYSLERKYIEGKSYISLFNIAY